MRYVYQRDDMLELLQERDGAGNLLAHYTIGDGLEGQRRGEDSSFYHYDWLGSTHELTDAAQAVTDTYRYDAWGNVLEATGSTVNPHTYVGRLRYYAMAGTGLYQLGYRELAAGAGRFLSVDPAEHISNWYMYARELPTALRDPSGLKPSKGTIYYILGATSDSLDETKPSGLAARAVPRASIYAAYTAAAKVLTACGYATRFLDGTPAAFDHANRDADTVGIITAGHGGCGYDPFTGDWGIWAQTVGKNGRTLNEYGAFASARGEWKAVAAPHRFVVVYPGHCWVYWVPGRKGKQKLIPGNQPFCKSLLARRMNIPPEKVRVPALADRDWWNGAYGAGEALPTMLWSAWYGSPAWFGCDRTPADPSPRLHAAPPLPHQWDQAQFPWRTREQ